MLVLSGFMLFQWYSESGDVDKAISVMMKALQKHSAAITAGGCLSSALIILHCDPKKDPRHY